jgi:hypothetical protein
LWHGRSLHFCSTRLLHDQPPSDDEKGRRWVLHTCISYQQQGKVSSFPPRRYWYVDYTCRYRQPLTSSSIGIFVNAAIKHTENLNGKQLYAATDYYTPERIIAEFEEITGKKGHYVQLTKEQYKGFFPEFMAEEILENHLLIEEPGYYNGASLDETHKLLSEKPTTWKAYLQGGAFD